MKSRAKFKCTKSKRKNIKPNQLIARLKYKLNYFLLNMTKLTLFYQKKILITFKQIKLKKEQKKK